MSIDSAAGDLTPYLTDIELKVIEATPGFMPHDEGSALHNAALAAAAGMPELPMVEIGTYCGKSTVYLAAAARSQGSTLVTVDHHRGSEENQPGWEWHDTNLVDQQVGQLDTLPTFRRAMNAAGLEDTVIAIVGRSEQVGELWHRPISLLFLDGGHTEEQAQADYTAWAGHLAPGGTLMIHDVFADPAEGGQAPFHVLERAVDEGFIEVGSAGSLHVLQRPI
jgi:predicted O-methyltransferase YrrM